MSGEKYDIKLIFSIIYIIGLILLRDIANIIIHPMITAAMCTIPLFILPKKSYISFVFFCLPTCFAIHGIFTIILSLVLYIRGANNTLPQIFFPVVILLLELVPLLYNGIYTIRYLDIVMYISYMCVFFYILFYKLSSEEMRDGLKYFCFGLAFILFTVYLRVIVQNGIMELLSNNLRSGAVIGEDETTVRTITNVAMNANNIAYYSITLFSVLLLGKNNLGMSSRLYAFLITISLLSGILSFSRTWIMLIILILVITYYKFNFTKKLYVFLLGFLGLSIVLSTDNVIYQMIYDSFLLRFEEGNFATAGGRTELFEEYNDFMMANPQYMLAGTGVVHYKDVCNCSNSIHNGIQQVYVCCGLIGILLFLSTIVHFYKKYRKAKFIQFIPFIAIFVFNQSIQSLYPTFLILPFICAVYALKLDIKSN